MQSKLWGGRFSKALNPAVRHFTYSLAVDGELLQAEVRVNQAHANMLARQGFLTRTEARKLVVALDQIGEKFRAKNPHENPLASFKDIEDVHTFVQLELEKKVGALAKKIHTGRSRNDLVVTSTLVYLKEKLLGVKRKIAGLQKVLVGFAEKTDRVIVPGLTHLQWAQPVIFAHQLLAYVGMLERDCERFVDTVKRMNKLPLGAAALGGSSLRIDPKYVARQLGFRGLAENSIDAVSDRDFALEALSALAILWTHLSRLAEDFVLWTSEAFRYVILDDSVATGSSLMPQKKNPDVFELVRGRAGVIFGHLLSLLTLLKGLPLAYNRDLQEDKPALFDAIHKTELALDVLSITISTARLAEGIRKWAQEDDFLYATDLLEFLVEKGVPFREAHESVGTLVRYALKRGKKLGELSLKEFRRFSSRFDRGVYSLLDPWASVHRKKTPASTHPAAVRKWLQFWKKKLKKV